MKRFAALALAGSIQLTALAGNPVSVHPPAAPKPANSMSQPLSAAVQSAAATLPAPAAVMTSTPSWGAPAVLPGTLVGAGCAPAGSCGDPTACPTVTPYFNVLAPRGGCDVVRGSCLDRLKDWFNYRSSPGGFGFTPTPHRATMRAYFPCTPTGSCGTAGCATGGGSCGPVTMPVQRLDATGCDTPACRPRVMYQPLSTRSEVPFAGCNPLPVRPRLVERMLGFFTPKWGGMCGDGTCTPGTYAPPLTTTWSSPGATTAPTTTWTTPGSPSVVPNAMPGTFVPSMSTTPMSGPVGKPGNGKPVQLSPAQPFTNP